MENKVKQCKHNVKLAFNNDEIISYCEKCGKILDRYVKVKNTSSYYYGNGLTITPAGTPVVTCNGKISGGDVGGSVTLTSDDIKSTLRG